MIHVHQIAAAHGRGVTQLLTLALTPHIEALSAPKVEENDEFDGEMESELSDQEKIDEAPKKTTKLNSLLSVSQMWVNQH